jgi:hypothetical protein
VLIQVLEFHGGGWMVACAARFSLGEIYVPRCLGRREVGAQFAVFRLQAL